MVDSLLVDRDVDEFQGSFSIDYTSQLDCVTPQLATMASSDSTLLMEGGFVDEGCDDVAFSMQVCPVQKSDFSLKLMFLRQSWTQ